MEWICRVEIDTEWVCNYNEVEQLNPKSYQYHLIGAINIMIMNPVPE